MADTGEEFAFGFVGQVGLRFGAEQVFAGFNKVADIGIYTHTASGAPLGIGFKKFGFGVYPNHLATAV